jgi:hypothetical protein
VLISLALVGLFLALITALAITVAKTGIAPQAVISYYRGVPVEGTADPLAALVLPSPRPFAELLEITHLHLTGGSMLLFLLCHLLSLCDMPDRARTWLYVISFVTFLTTFTLPWGIVYLSPLFAWLYGPSVVVLLGTLALLMILPLREMWIR